VPTRIVLVALAAALVTLGAHTATIQPWTVDDAYIAFRYADHWGSGLGPVYNPGEAVEGFTSLGWVALLAVLAGLGAPLEGAARVLGLLGAAGIFVALATLRPPRAAAIAVLLAATAGPLTAWAGGGMEVAPAALVVLLVLAVGARLLEAPTPAGAFRAGLASAFGAVVRPELVLVLAALALGLAAGRRWREAALATVGAIAGYAPVEIWRLVSYGWPLPNTAYVKVGATPEQLARGLEALLSAGPAFVALVLLAPLALSTRSRGVRLALGWAALHAAFFVAVGGDGLPGHRLLVPLVAPLAACAGLGLDALAPRRPWAPILVVPAAAAQVLASAADPELTTRIREGHVGRNGREVGLWLRETYGPDAVVATNTAGSVAWFSGLVTIDTLGLCDAHIAHVPVAAMGTRKAGHEKADGAYVLSRAPDVVLFGAARGRERPLFASDLELWALPDFQKQYRYEQHHLPSGATLRLYRRVER